MTSQSRLYSVSHIRDLKQRRCLNGNHFPSPLTLLSHSYMLQWGFLVLFAVRLYLIIIPCECSTYCWTINLSLSLHQTAERQRHLHPRGFRSLQEAAKPAQDVRKGLFSPFEGFDCWKTLAYLGKFSNGTKKACPILMGKSMWFTVRQYLQATPKLEKVVFAQEEDRWFIMHEIAYYLPQL